MRRKLALLMLLPAIGFCWIAGLINRETVADVVIQFARKNG